MLILKSRLTAALEKFPSNLEPVHDVGMNTIYHVLDLTIPHQSSPSENVNFSFIKLWLADIDP